MKLPISSWWQSKGSICVCLFLWKMILNQRPAEKACYMWAPINQNPSCAFCVKNDFESMISWWTMFYLSTKSIHNTSLPPSSSFTSGVHFLPCCLLLDIRFLQVVWWRFFNRLMAEDAHYLWIANQFTRPLSLLLPRSHLEFVQHPSPPVPPGVWIGDLSEET